MITRVVIVETPFQNIFPASFVIEFTFLQWADISQVVLFSDYYIPHTYTQP